jgi:hypothetical protein
VDATDDQVQKHQARLAAREARRVRAKSRRRTMRTLVISAGVLSFAGTIALVHFTQLLEPAPMPPMVQVAVSPAPRSAPVRVADPDRPVFKYSIVPGGVRSAAEVVLAMQRDPVVAAHYAAVIPTILRAQTLTEPMSVHVSYRVGDKVYWTKKKLTLNAGEKILTDGTTALRERCGNMLSLEPLAPALEAEPAPPEFELHVDPFMPAPGILLDPPDPAVPMTFGMPPGAYPPVPPLGPPPKDPPAGTPSQFSAPTTVPEPSTWMLVSIGLGAAAAKLFRKRT